MKTIIRLYIVFLAGLLFFYSYDSYNYIHFLKIQELDNGLSADGRKGDYYELTWESDHPKQRQAALSAMVTHAREQGISYVASGLMPTDDGTYQFHYYVQSEEDRWVYERIRMVDGETVDLTDPATRSYLSSMPEDTNAAGHFASYDLRYFDAWKQEIRIYSAGMLPQCDSDEIALYIDPADDGTAFSAWVEEQFGNIVSLNASELNSGTDADIETSYKNDDIRLALTVSLCILVLLLLCLGMKEKREIMIRKMLGHSTFRIVIQLTARFLCELLLLFAAVLVLLCMVVTPTFSAYYQELYQDIAQYLWIGCLAIPLLLMIAALFVRSAIHASDLKNTTSLQWMSRANLVLKIALSCMLLMPLITSINRLIPNMQHYLFLRKHGNEIQELYTFSYFNGKRDDLQELYDAIIYFDLSDFTNFSDRHAYSYYGMSNADLGFPPQPAPLLYVNKTYLNKKGLQYVDTEGHPIDLDELQDKTYLIPPSKQYVEAPEDGTVIYVRSTGFHVDLQAGILGGIDEPILVVYPRFSGMNVNESGMFFDQGDRWQIEAMIEAVCEEDYLLHSQQSLISRLLTDASNAMFSSGTNVVLFGLLYGLFIIQFCSIYITQHQRELVLAYMAGKARCERYGPMILVLLASYLNIVLIGTALLNVPLSICVEFVLLCILVDVIHFYFFVRHAEKHMAVPALKGGE